MGSREKPARDGGRTSQAPAIAMVLASTIFIAVVPSFAKLAYTSGASVPMVVATRFFVTVLWLGMLLAITRRRLFTSVRVLRLCAIGGIATAAMSFGVVAAIARIDLSLVILIVYLHPVIIAWIGHLRGTYVLSRFRLFCCFLILLGLSLALSVSLARLDVAGVALAFLGACGASGLIVTNGDAVVEGGTLIVNFYTSVTALILVSVVALVIGPVVPPGTHVGWFGLLGTGTAFCLGLVLFLEAIPRIGVVRATLLTVVEPVIGVFFAVALFGDRLTAVQWTGVAVVVAGLLLLEIPAKESDRLLEFVRARLRA